MSAGGGPTGQGRSPELENKTLQDGNTFPDGPPANDPRASDLSDDQLADMAARFGLAGDGQDSAQTGRRPSAWRPVERRSAAGMREHLGEAGLGEVGADQDQLSFGG